jgi:hypothetical protein
MDSMREGRSSRRPGVPPPQKNLDRATELAFDDLGGQAEEQLVWLGAKSVGTAWRVSVLEDALDVDLSASSVTTSAGQPVGPHWRILALHYLGIRTQPERLAPEVTFADLATARSYAGVYHQRVVARLCATAGRDAQTFRTAASAVSGHRALGGDEAFDFDVFPRLTLRLIWHAPDEEFPASATLLLPANIESYFCSEDVVVLSECLVSRLGGRSF